VPGTADITFVEIDIIDPSNFDSSLDAKGVELNGYRGPKARQPPTPSRPSSWHSGTPQESSRTPTSRGPKAALGAPHALPPPGPRRHTARPRSGRWEALPRRDGSQVVLSSKRDIEKSLEMTTPARSLIHGLRPRALLNRRAAGHHVPLMRPRRRPGHLKPRCRLLGVLEHVFIWAARSPPHFPRSRRWTGRTCEPTVCR